MAENKIIVDGVETTVGDAGEPLRRNVPPGCRPASREALSVFVAGTPAPQGSKRPLGRRGGRHVMVESSKKVKPWRRAIRDAFTKSENIGLGWHDFPVRVFEKGTALVVMIVFVMPRPVSTPKTKPTPLAVKRPDVDKLTRAVLDALDSTSGAGVFADDSQVITVHAHKRVAELGEPTGAMIHIQPAVSMADPLGPRGVGCYPPVDMSGFVTDTPDDVG